MGKGEIMVMKKRISLAAVALAIVAASSMTAFASGINANEQAVLDKLSSTTVNYKGRTLSLPSSYLNQAKNYMYTVDLTADQCNRIIALIDEAKAIMTNSGSKGISDADVKSQVLAKANQIASILNMSVTQEQTDQGSKYTLKDSDGNVAFSASPKVDLEAGTLVDGTVVKTTGLGIELDSLFAVLALLSAATVSGSLYLIKCRSEA